MTAWNLLDAVILSIFSFIIRAFPTALKRNGTMSTGVSNAQKE